MPETSPSINPAAVAALLQIPQPATSVPRSEMTGGSTGSQMGRFAMEDHQHPRLTSTTTATVTTGSAVALSFTRTFINKPGVVCTEFEGATGVSAQPAVFKVESWATDANGAYTGCTIRVWRSQTVPQNLSTLLLGAVFNLFSASVVGTVFSCIAVARSDVSAS